MIKNSLLYRTMFAAWDLACDRPLPVFMRPDKSSTAPVKNTLYMLPVWGAIGGIAALIAGKILSFLLPVNGCALLFALLMVILGEMRTNSRGMSLSVTFLDGIISGKGFADAQRARCQSLKECNGIIPLLLALSLMGGKFLLIFMVARTGHFGAAGAALVIALSVEAFLAAEPAAADVPEICQQAHGEYIIALAGFFLLFNLISLPLATLIATGAAAIITMLILNLCLSSNGRITSDDMTMTGYILDFAVWLCTALLIG